MPTPVSKTSAPLHREAHRDITEAVRDTVTVRGVSDSPRNRVGRSHTAMNPPPTTRPPAQRSHSQDSAGLADKAKANKTRPKKGSQHADVIDRLDFTGVGPMFHHDGPFDACAPSRNRQRNKAPLHSWTVRPDDALTHPETPYPAPHAYKALTGNYPDTSKKKVDAIAEAWGIHEPEPYEEFFAGGVSTKADGDTPASSIYNGRESYNSNSTSRSNPNSTRRAKDARDPRDIYKEYLEEGPQPHNSSTRSRVAARRTSVPPPQPIFVPNPVNLDKAIHSPHATSPGFPKRSKSLMQRIRKMREAPNVPVSADSDDPPSPVEHSYPGNSPGTPRPTHRSQNSFLGRFGGGPRGNIISEKPEPFVYIEAQTNKELPATPNAVEDPLEDNSAGYFSDSPGVGRRASLMRKVGRVVRGRQ